MFIEVCFFFLTLEQDGQKSGGAMPPSLKSGGATGPPAPPPGSTAYEFCYVVGMAYALDESWLFWS